MNAQTPIAQGQDSEKCAERSVIGSNGGKGTVSRTVALSKGDGRKIVGESDRKVSSRVRRRSPSHKTLVNTIILAFELHVYQSVLHMTKKRANKSVRP